MQNNNTNVFPELNNLIQKLFASNDKREILNLGLGIADEVMRIIGIPDAELDQGDDELDKALPSAKFKNQKMETWFEKHPYFASGRVALYHYNKGTYPIESMFYELSDLPKKAKIAATSQLFTNWEDSDLTMLPQYKVGIDFFLCPKTKSILLVLSKKQNLRVLELSEKLTNTQIEIFRKIQGCVLFKGVDPSTNQRLPFEPQRTIHKNLWDAFQLKEVNKKFYIGISDFFQELCQYLQKHLPASASQGDVINSAQIFSNRLIGRILFAWFLKKKDIIDINQNYFDTTGLSSSDYYSTKLKKLFFCTLNTPIEKRKPDGDLITPYLNGGLFEARPSDWPNDNISFPDGWFSRLFKHLDEFNFTTDESSPEYEQIAIDPEMLGRVFENLLATIVPATSSIATERNNKGAFYTPREIVSYMCKTSLREFLKRHVGSEKDYDGIDRLIDLSDSDFLSQKSTGLSELWGIRSNKVQAQLIESLNNLKILDPACGSGAFPIGMMQLLVKTFDRLGAVYDAKILKMRLGISTEHYDSYFAKLFIIKNCLYGIDIEPMAIEISRLRAWLSLIIDDKKDVLPLPNLDFNFICANSLVPLGESHQGSLFDDEDNFKSEFAILRAQFFDAHDPAEKSKLKKYFSQLYSKEAIDSYGQSDYFRMINSWEPFISSQPAEFFDPKHMFDIDYFDIIIGNPPYINFNDIKEDSHKIYQPLKYSTYKATGDMYCLFIERGIDLLKPKGILTFITSNKWMRAGYGEALRDFISKNANPLLLVDFGGTKVFDSATVDTDIIQLAREPNIGKTVSCVIKQDCLDNLNDYIKQYCSLSYFCSSKSWIIMSNVEAKIKEKIEKVGEPLSNWNIIINYGIKTGLNEAFVINEAKRDEIIKRDPKSAELIRPILRGKDIRRYTISFKKLYLLAIDNGNKEKSIPPKNIEDYPGIKEHLDHYYHNLVNRDDRGDTPYNLRNCVYMDEFYKQKIIYPCIMRDGPHFALDKAGNYFTPAPGNIITGENLEFLLGCLCSKTYYFVLRRFYMGGGIEGELKTNRLLMLPVVPFRNESDFIVIVNSVKEIYQRIQAGVSFEHEIISIEQHVQNIIGLTDDEKNYINMYKFD
jgi:hypothetical protein